MEKQIKKLERRIRIQSISMFAIVIVFTGGAVMTQRSGSYDRLKVKNLEVEALVVKDDKDKIRILIGTNDGSCGIMLVNEKLEDVRYFLSQKDDKVTEIFYDKNMKQRIINSVTNDSVSFALFDEKEVSRVLLKHSPGQSVSIIALKNEAGFAKVAFMQKQEAGAMFLSAGKKEGDYRYSLIQSGKIIEETFLDDKMKPRIKIISSGGAVVKLMDENGKIRVGLTHTEEDGSSAIILFNKKQEVVESFIAK